MIKISTPQDQLRSNRNLLALVGGSSTIIGLLVWSSSPFLFPNPKDRVEISLRYISLFITSCCGVTAVVTGYQLQRITPLIKAIETAEKNDFISQLATSQWIQEQHYQREAVTALQPSSQPAVTMPVTSSNENSYNDRNDANSRDNEVTQKPVTDSLTNVTEGVTTAVTDEGMEGYRPMYLAVTALQQQGISDSDIIKDTLKMGGTNYAKGKAMLEALLQLGQSQDW
jgi:signal transduction histidine kinase